MEKKKIERLVMDIKGALQKHQCIVWKGKDYAKLVLSGEGLKVYESEVPELHIGIYPVLGKMIAVFETADYKNLKSLHPAVFRFFDIINNSNGICFVATNEEDVHWHLSLEINRVLSWPQYKMDLLEKRFITKIHIEIGKKYDMMDGVDIGTFSELLQYMLHHKEYDIWDVYLNSDSSLGVLYGYFLKYYRNIMIEIFKHNLCGRVKK